MYEKSVQNLDFTILYVEDHKTTQQFIKKILKHYFNKIITASNGLEALEKFNQFSKLDLIITDIHMPLLDGISMIKAIRNIDEEIPILVISAYNDTNYLMEVLQQNVQGYILKPLQKNQFLQTITTIKSKILKKRYQKNQNPTQKNIFLDIIDTAIKQQKVISYFQPIVNNQTQQTIKYESLLRIQDEKNNILTPNNFLQNIKQYEEEYIKLIVISLENSFEALNKTSYSISINLSINDIENFEIHKKIFELLEKFKQESHRIVFELLKDETSYSMEMIQKFINNIKFYGVKIAIDDFGTGYSNFEHILHYQPDILKIDGSLIQRIMAKQSPYNMIEAIVTFSQKENIQTVAEYVDCLEIYEAVKNLQIDFSQGYYFGQAKAL